MKVADVLRSKGDRVETIGAGERLDMTARRMAAHGIGCLVVTGLDGRLLGVVEERDVVRAVATGTVELRRARDVVDDPVVTCYPEQPLVEVMALMTRTRRRHVPVLDDGRLAGVVS